jgi:hypothetical protein
VQVVVLAFGLCAFAMNSAHAGGKKGLDDQGYDELSDVGVDKYIGDFTPVLSTDVGDGWTKHTFDPDGGNGPICIAGTPFSAFTREGNPDKLVIFEQGGGACWQDFYNCNVLSEAQEPPGPASGLFDFASKDNPYRDYSIVYMPYCDGSVFSGDNDVFDPAFGAAIGVPAAVVRFHRGLRNQTAGMDLARDTFPDAQKIHLIGHSAGGVGIAGFAPFLARFEYGNNVKLSVFNDAGPVAVNLDPGNAAAQADIEARAADWQFEQFYPASCTDCAINGQATEIIKWRLDHDSEIREAFYETDADATNRFFTRQLLDPAGFRALIVTEHGLINDAYPDRYKRFIVAGDASHGAIQWPSFYTKEANGVMLHEWTKDFVNNSSGWVDIVEDAVLP